MTYSVTRTSTNDEASDARREAPLLPYLFRVLDCELPNSGGARYALVDTDEVTLGRGAEHGGARTTTRARRLALELPGKEVSSRHARLIRGDDGWRLEDLDSKNGTFVDEQRVEHRLLRDGDVFAVGRTFFRFRAALASPAGPSDLDPQLLAPLPEGVRTLLPDLEDRHSALGRAAESNITMLLLGETGTGKERLARAIHQLSGRKGPFIAVNCGALPPNLVESTLFGHVKGAFSGAIRVQDGAFAAAEGGTLLLDEIGELPKPAQPALLRVLQERQITPVGSPQTRAVNVRVIAATHRPLSGLCETGEFREDLLARLEGYVHTLPALRERIEDLGLLIKAILSEMSPARRTSLSMAAGWRLLGHSFHANVRELAQALARAVAVAKDAERLTPEDLQLKVRGPQRQTLPPSLMTPVSSLDADPFRSELVAHLERHRGNVTDVAGAIGRSRVQVYRWLVKYEIDPNAFRR